MKRQQENLEKMEQLAMAKQQERIAQMEKEAREKMANYESNNDHSSQQRSSSSQHQSSSAVYTSGTASAEVSRIRSSLLEDTAMLLQANPMVGML